jgi:hypothetical protein
LREELGRGGRCYADVAVPAEPEPYLPFPVPREAIPLAREYRSTMLRSTVAILEQRGLHERYVAELAPEHREAILGSVPAVWLPLEVGMAHYEACDRLGLTEIEQASIGWETARRFHGPVMMTALRLAGSVSSPWFAASLAHRNWGRVWKGSAMAITRLASDEALVELAGWPASRIAYARVAFRGALRGTVEYFCRRAQLSEVRHLRTDTSLGFRVKWF